jgi:N-acetyl-alpha-D-glucosaminyl L-malate synthase BshA
VKIGISCYPTYGGSGAIATELGLKLAERGHETHFMSYAQPFRLDRFQERVFFHEVEMDDYPLFEHPPYSLALAVAIHNAALREELDLVHVHYAIPHATSAWIAKEMLGGDGVKVVTTLHGTDITLVWLHPSYQAITQFSILKSDGLTAVSEFLKTETVRDFDVPADRIRVIPNFVDPEVWRPDREPCHRKALAPQDEKIIMHVSNFRPLKRVTDVVDVFARVRAQMPARLVFVGDGPERARAEEKADELGIRQHVLFLGKHASVDELLSCADLFLLPSESESFGLAALEAMACGAPVIASAVGGLREIVTHGENGYLFPVGDVDSMAAAALEVLGNADVSDRLAATARTSAIERFSSARVVPMYEAYYTEVIEGAAPGRRVG